MKEKLLERFLRYISIDTQSDPESTTFPSTKKQFDLANLLVKELKELGLEDAHVDEHCYVMATLPANTDKDIPVIGFVAHVDTAPDMDGHNIKPRIVKNYDGQDILLNKEKDMWLKVEDFPELAKYKGQTVITTDGTTLLGADDKAGVAEIMAAIEHLVNNPDIKHGTIKVGFTPDEEIGKGVDHFDVKKFGAKYAYTLDGSEVGELEFENFNAASAKIKVQGRNVHPGYAKNKMVNAILIGSEFNDMLPVFERPEFTEHYEGFFHLIKFEGTVEEASFQYIIRDHDRKKFERRKEQIREVADFMNKKYGEGTFSLEVKDQYYNMREKVEPVYQIVEIAEQAMKDLGIKPRIKPIRGGTDGARLSYMGLPCPNLFAGGLNFHGKYEYIPLESMEKATSVMLKIINLYYEKA
ncbi:MAG: peptidase T [Bacteroidales bacterium]|jgi:tripeptide aminopeptidase|nr:peptidase T [Bacteroidales bacterium]NLM92737.1 peptidase T [Bacteroidales bacterium]